MVVDYSSHDERRNATAREQSLERIKAEFTYLAGLTLSQPQVNRIFHLQNGRGERVMEQLVGTGFVRRSADGSFARTVERPLA